MRKCFAMRVVLLILAVSILAGCGNKEKDKIPEEGSFRIYGLNRNETALIYENYMSGSTDRESLIQDLLTVMGSEMKDNDHKAPLKMGFSVRNCILEGDQLKLDLSSEYLEMNPTREILVRAAIVRTLTQIGGVNAITITVDELPFMDAGGNYVGTLTADSFVENEGVEINAYDKATLHLYFANETGDKLVECNRSVMYNTNLPMERLVIEQLIDGPEGDEGYATLNPYTRVISVTVTDGVCFVNLDSAFLESPGNVTPQVSIYSIVNSLAELSTVHKVQFLVNGEGDVMFREVMDLEDDFSRNLDIVE